MVAYRKTLLSWQKLSLVLHFLQLKLDGKKQLEEYKDVSKALKDVSCLVWEIYIYIYVPDIYTVRELW